MRIIWLVFGCLLLGLLGLRFFLPRPTAELGDSPTTSAPAVVLVSQRSASPLPTATGPRDSLVRLALRQIGTPYVWAGTSPRTGFDCSGFITYVFGQFGVATPHATALLIDAGRPVPRAQAQPGDIVVFTGTAEGSTTPGHAGIVISALGETPLRFVHASSARRESGVKISQVENSGYERRFMQVRRVLGGASSGANPQFAAAGRPAVSRPLTRPAGAVAPLVPAPPEITADLAVALPTRLAPVPVRRGAKASVKAPTAHTKTRAKYSALAKPAAATKKAAIRKASSQKAVLKKPAAAKKPIRPTARPKSAAHRAKPKSR